MQGWTLHPEEPLNLPDGTEVEMIAASAEIQAAKSSVV